jgi:hypothetical protein
MVMELYKLLSFSFLAVFVLYEQKKFSILWHMEPFPKHGQFLGIERNTVKFSKSECLVFCVTCWIDVESPLLHDFGSLMIGTYRFDFKL